jgi:hypothetical protein
LDLITQAVRQIVGLHLEASQTNIGRHQVEVFYGALDDGVVEGKRLGLHTCGRLGLDEDMREGAVIDFGLDP